MDSASNTISYAQAVQYFRQHGITIAEWAGANGFNPALVYVVLAGKRKCLRGQSHRIAVALRLKTLPQDDILMT